ncbi:hypothetical protein FRC18_003042 [Serendipita sp. 400]|nr:hypothetical protein FRC18_003042 [Serendipita sp. 400]
MSTLESLQTVEVLALCETNPVPRYLRNVGSRIKEADEEDLRRFLQNLGKIDTKVHSLICETVLRFDAVKLHQIQTTLPRLTSLTLHANAISGQFDMPCLTNLNVSSIHLDITRWNLPSLKHFAIGYLGTGPRVPPRTPPRDVVRLLPRNSYQLLSLMVFSPYKLVLNPSFWYAHPFLECLGVTQYEMQAGPSLEHPLSTICFNFASTGTDGDHFLQMAQHLVFFPWISTLITPNLDRRNIAEEEESSCVELIKICSTRNIRWYVRHGERFEYTPQRQSKW